MPKTYADSITGWQRRLQALTANADEVAHLESRRTKLQGIYEGTLGAMREQSAATASKQEASRLLEALVAEGNKVDNFLCAGLREHYGNRSEKLAEFDLQPFRGRRPAKEVPPPPVETVVK